MQVNVEPEERGQFEKIQRRIESNEEINLP